MSRSSQFKTLFCLQIMLALINAIVCHEDIIKHMSFEERRSFFGTEDGSVPEFELVELARPARSKRATQKTMDITFDAFGTISTATLNIVDNRLVTRSLTGIWLANSDVNAYHNVVYTPKPDTFDSLGDIELLQNPNDGSAITRFRLKNGDETILGVLKQNYTVKSVPRKFDYLFVNIHRTHARRKRSTSSKSQREPSQLLVVFKSPDVSQELFRIRRRARDSVLPEIERHRRKRQNAQPSGVVPNVVYPKLLVCPDYSLIMRYWYIEESVRQVIALFNAVDMMFRQLRDPEVRLTIAGIIIPRGFSALPFIQTNTDVDSFNLNARVALNATRLYFANENRRFPRGNYDVVFILTMMPMYAYDATTGKKSPIDGISKIGYGCIGGPAMAKFMEGIVGVHLIAHELGHVFGAIHDEEHPTTLQCPISDGYTLVSDSKQAKILGWSTCSKLSFTAFFGSNDGSCTYNPPHEVVNWAQGMPGAWLPIPGQCDNHFVDSMDYCVNDTTNSCSDYGCMRNGSCFWMNDPPMEGSWHANAKSPSMRCVGQMWQST